MTQTTIELPIYNAEAIHGALILLEEHLQEKLETTKRARGLDPKEKLEKAHDLNQEIVRLQGLLFSLNRDLEGARMSNSAEPTKGEPL